MTTQILSDLSLSLLPLVYLSRQTVEALTGFSHTTLYKMMREGNFPQCYRLGPQKRGWKYAEVEAWLTSRLQLNAGDKS